MRVPTKTQPDCPKPQSYGSSLLPHSAKVSKTAGLPKGG